MPIKAVPVPVPEEASEVPEEPQSEEPPEAPKKKAPAPKAKGRAAQAAVKAAAKAQAKAQAALAKEQETLDMKTRVKCPICRRTVSQHCLLYTHKCPQAALDAAQDAHRGGEVRGPPTRPAAPTSGRASRRGTTPAPATCRASEESADQAAAATTSNTRV